MYIKNNKGLKIDPCGTSAQISAEEEHRPFKTTLCFLSLRKFSKILIISLQISF